MQPTSPVTLTLTRLHIRYNKAGLEIVAFPCNQFGGEEAGSDAEIRQYVTKKFGFSGNLMQKVDVNGGKAVSIFLGILLIAYW